MDEARGGDEELGPATWRGPLRPSRSGEHGTARSTHETKEKKNMDITHPCEHKAPFTNTTRSVAKRGTYSEILSASSTWCSGHQNAYCSQAKSDAAIDHHCPEHALALMRQILIELPLSPTDQDPWRRGASWTPEAPWWVRSSGTGIAPETGFALKWYSCMRRLRGTSPSRSSKHRSWS